MPIQVKICGLKTATDVESAVAAGANFVGFVDHSASPRHINPSEVAKNLLPLLPRHVKSVIVKVNPDNDWVDHINAHTAPDFIQLHGKEFPSRVVEIKKRCRKSKIIKAIPIRTASDLVMANLYAEGADMLLFDAKPTEDDDLPGGNGIPFDWSILNGFLSPVPWFLSGGLTTDNVSSAIGQTGAARVDVSSGVESSAGVKDTALINTFIIQARS